VCTVFWRGNLAERYYWGHPDVDGRIILRWIFSKWDVGVWTGLSWIRDRDRWRALVNAVMNVRVPQNAGNFLTSLELVSFSRRTLLRGVSKYVWS